MSYDIYFYKKKDSPLTVPQVADYLNKQLPHNTSKTTTAWHYENPDTGVYFSITTAAANDDVVKELDVYAGYKLLPYVLHINLLRPHYFGVEAFGIVGAMIDRLVLYLLNPQHKVDDSKVTHYTGDMLLADWASHNEQVVLQKATKFGVPHMALARAMNIWQYQFGIEQLQQKLGAGIYVSSYLLIKSKENGKLYTACVWPECIPVVLPPVDFVIIHKKYKRFLINYEEQGMIAYNQLMQQLSASFEPFTTTVDGVVILRPAKAASIVSKFNDLPLIGEVKNFGTLIAMDGFVTIK